MRRETTADLMQRAEAAYVAGRLEETLEALEQAHATALDADDPMSAAGAATQLAMHLLIDTGLMAPVRAWLKRAEIHLEGLDDTPVHAWIGVVRACERWLSGDFDAARVWAQRAIDAGDRHEVQGAATFGRVAYARCAIYDGDIDEGLRLLDDAAARLLFGEFDPLTAGCLYCEIVCIWQGLARYDLAEEWTDTMERFSHDHAVGSVNGRCRVHRAEILRLRGALPEAERTALDACEQLRPYMRYEFGWPLTELGRIRLTRGDLAGAEEAFVSAHEMGWDPQPGLARLHLAKGDTAAALASIQDALEHPLNVPSKERPPNNDLRRAPLLDALVEIAIAGGDVSGARRANDELARIASSYRGKALEAGSALATGRVRLAEGDAAGARRSLQNAVYMWSEVGAPYETAIARTVLALAHNAEGNAEMANLETQAATSTFSRLGIRDLTEPTATAELQVNEFRREGEYWSITFGGTTVRIRDMKGLHHLARLMGDPGREFHAVDLVTLDHGTTAPDEGIADPELQSSIDSDAGELLDARAKELYRRRLEEIEEDIDEAQRLGDNERVTRANVEKDFLMQELSRAVGLGGRDRRAGATSERARASVTRAIRNAIMKVAAQSADLGEHLERTVRTGTYCVYLPDPRVPVDWIL